MVIQVAQVADTVVVDVAKIQLITKALSNNQGVRKNVPTPCFCLAILSDL